MDKRVTMQRFFLYAAYLITATLLLAGFSNSWYFLAGIAAGASSYYLGYKFGFRH